jgi:hypothetical protein
MPMKIKRSSIIRENILPGAGRGKSSPLGQKTAVPRPVFYRAKDPCAYQARQSGQDLFFRDQDRHSRGSGSLLGEHQVERFV